MINTTILKKEIVEIGRRIYARGYVAANDGNISARIDDQSIVISPTGVSKGFMTPEMMVITDMNGTPRNKTSKASSEIHMHLKIYEKRSDINAIVHAHPPYSTAFSVSGIPLTQATLPEVIITLGGIPLAEYGTPGTSELFDHLMNYVHDYDAFLLQNHGALAIGQDLTRAYFRMETLEHCAHITYIAHQLGRINTLSTSEVNKLLEQRKNLGLHTHFKGQTCSAANFDACSILADNQTVIMPKTDAPTSRTTASPSNHPEINKTHIDGIIHEILNRLGIHD